MSDDVDGLLPVTTPEDHVVKTFKDVVAHADHIQELIPEEETSTVPTSARSPEMLRHVAAALTSLGKGDTPAARLKAAGLNPSIYTQVCDMPGFTTALKRAVARFVLLPKIPELVAEQIRQAAAGKTVAYDRAMALYDAIDESGEEPMIRNLMALDNETARANLREMIDRLEEQLAAVSNDTTLDPENAAADAEAYMAARIEEPEKAAQISHALIHRDDDSRAEDTNDAASTG